jgi:hypothetical protein
MFYHNILKCVNLIEIRFYAYRYAASFLVLWHIIFETTAQVPEVELGGKYRCLRAVINYYIISGILKGASRAAANQDLGGKYKTCLSTLIDLTLSQYFEMG